MYYMSKNVSDDMHEIANQVATARTEVRGIITGFATVVDNLIPKPLGRKGLARRIIERRSAEKPLE